MSKLLKLLNESLSLQVAQTIKSQAKKPFENAYKALLVTDGAKYVQGFLVLTGHPYKPIEHAWIELEDVIIDPSFAYLQRKSRKYLVFPRTSFNPEQIKSNYRRIRRGLSRR